MAIPGGQVVTAEGVSVKATLSQALAVGRLALYPFLVSVDHRYREGVNR